MHQIGPSSLPAYIPVPSGGETLDVTNWNLLRFSPLGIYHLRRWQGAFPGIKDFFFSHQGRFRSADLAWFSSRLNRDGNHDHPRTSFHPSLATLHKDTNSPRGKIERKDLLAELKEQLFDIVRFYITRSVYLRIIYFFQATMYDRLTGGTMMIISSSGTTVPGAPARPEYLKASIYLPPAFIAHHRDLHHHIINIVQHYIETIGVRTVNMWIQRARRDLHYSLTQVGNPHQNALFTEIPSPEYNSAQYTFLGQPYRITDDPTALPPVRTPSISPVASADSYDFGEEPDANTLTIIDLQQHNSELQEKIQVLEQQIRDLNKLVSSTPHPTPSKYKPATPSRKTPEGRSTRHNLSGTPSPGLSRSLPRLQFGSRLEHASRASAHSRQASPFALQPAHTPDELQPPFEQALSRYIKLYHLEDLADSINLISNYAPAENRRQELSKLGLEEGTCDSLTLAMALDEQLKHI